jgi:hypothetical protein
VRSTFLERIQKKRRVALRGTVLEEHQRRNPDLIGVMPAVLDAAELQKQPSTTDKTETRSLQVYALLTSWTNASADARILSKSIKDGNGYQLWQRLVSHYEPKTMSKALVRRRALQTPSFPKTEDERQVALLDWEAGLTQYNDETGRDLEDDDKRGVSLEVCPAKIKQHLQENIDDLNTYQEMPDKIISYLSSERKWDPGRRGDHYGSATQPKADPNAMQVDAFSGARKGGGKAKDTDKGKGKGKEGKDRKQGGKAAGGKGKQEEDNT